MGKLTIEEARLQIAVAHPNLSADDVRREADDLIAKLDTIAAADDLRAVIEAQAADEAAQQAAAAQLRAEAFAAAAAITRKSQPGWDAASVEMQAHKLVAENEAGIAALSLRDAVSEGYDR